MMDIPRIFESIIITNEKLEGILARIEFLIGELEDEKSHLYFATQAHAPEHHIMSSEKKFNEFFTHHTREVRKAAIKPQLETIQEVVSIKNTVVEVLRMMQEARVHLDLMVNPSLAMPALTMVASLTNLMMLVSSPLLAPARIFHEIYQRLTQTNDDSIKELKDFMEKYQPHPVDILQEELSAYQDMISNGVTSAQKVLHRAGRQVETQLGNLLASQDGIVTPDQLRSAASALGHRDILQPGQVARVAFLSFLAVGTPWDVRTKNGAGYEVIKTILTSGWVLDLHRHIVTNLHSTLRNTLDRSKDNKKQAKKRMISDWEREALLKAPIERRDQRRKLADIMEKYCWLMEDQASLIGRRLFLLLTLLAHAAHEVNWLVLHQNGEVKRKMEKESEEAMATDQETIRLLFYIVRLRQMLKESKDITRDYIVTSTQRRMAGLHEEEGVKLNELDPNGDWKEMLEKVQNGVFAIRRDVTDAGLHRYDLGRLITSLSSPTAITASSPAQSCPQLLISLEQVYLQMWILEGPVSLAKHVSNMKVLYFFQDTFRDNFKHLLNRFDNIFSHAIAFPALCEDFVSVLHPDCPEEYEEVLQETRNLASEFTEEIASNSVKLVEKYCQLIINQERGDVNIRDAAKLFHEKEADTKRKEQEKGKEKGKGKKGSRRERSKTMKKVAKKRGALFSEPIEKMTIAMKELFNIFGSQPSLNVAGFTFRPTAAFQEKLYEKILDKTRALIALEGRTQDPVMPSLVLQGLNTYQAALTSIDPGLHFATMFQEALFSTRTDDPHPFLVKYVDKILGNLRSPQVFYCEPLACFVGLSKEMHIAAHPIEKLTSAHELESLFEIFGVDGQLFIAQRLTQAMSQQTGKVIELLTANSALLSDHEAREREGSWRGLDQIPGFLEATIELGKLVALAELMDSAIRSVTKDRVGFLEAAIDNICTSDMSRLLGVPDSILPIASAMGFPKVTGQGESGKFQAEQLLIMTSVLLPLLARLETMRYYPHMMNSSSPEDPAPLLEAHHNSINCLLYALSYLRGDQESEGDSCSLLARYALPLAYVKPEAKDEGSGNLGTLLLALALLPQDCGIPFSVELSLKRSAMLDNSPRPEALTLQSEFDGRRIAKLMKK